MNSHFCIGLGVVLSLIAVPSVSLANVCTSHSDYRTALHRSGNAALGVLIDAGNWTVYDSCPQIARTGDGAIRYFRAATGRGIPFDLAIESPDERVRKTLMAHKAALGLYSDRSQLFYKRMTSSHGALFYRFGQSYDGYTVLGAEVIAQTDGETTYAQSISGDVLRDTYSLDCFPESLDVILSAQEAQANALQYLQPLLESRIAEQLAGLERAVANGDITEERADEIRASYAETILINGDAPVELAIHAPEVLGASGEPRVAYITDVFSTPTQLISYQVFIDAQTGAELRRSSYTSHQKALGESGDKTRIVFNEAYAALSDHELQAIEAQLAALGDGAAVDLTTEFAMNSLPRAADHIDLFLGLQNAAMYLYSHHTTPTLEAALAAIDEAAGAVGIASHEKLAIQKCGLPEPEIRTDISGDGVTDSVDIQRSINAVLGTGTVDDADVNDDGMLDAVDIQFVINAVLAAG